MVQLYGHTYSRKDIIKRVGLIDQIAGIRLEEMSDGIGRGLRTASIRTGSGLSATVLIDRGLDIYDADFKGVPLAWLSATGPTHPAYFEAPGLGWRRAFFGGLMLTCGLTTIGAPSTDEGCELGLHGRISNLPASQINVDTNWDGDDYVMSIEGKVRETVVFGENLLLHRRIKAYLGDTKISVFDTVTNDGNQPTPHMILYHVNGGFPVVEQGARFLSPTRKLTARDADAQAGIIDWSRISEPTTAYREQVFFHEMVADLDGYVTVALVNPAFGDGMGFGLYVKYRQEELPCFNQWKMMSEKVYSVGMEPATNWVLGRAKAREDGLLQYLEPGEERNYHLEIGVVKSIYDIAELAHSVMQKGGHNELDDLLGDLRRRECQL